MKIRSLLTAVLAVGMCLILVGCGNNAKTPESAAEYIGTNYELVVDSLETAGFSNISVNEVPDLTSSSRLQDGDVGAISIDGINNFEKKSSFSKDAQVVIDYHTIVKLELPWDNVDIEHLDYLDLATTLKDVGFTNIVTEEVFDLDPDSIDTEFVNEVSINGRTTFTKGDQFPYDAKISIVCHKTYEKYTLNLHIDFLGNLLFNCYDVCVSVNDDHVGILEHGKDGDFQLRLKEGNYVLSFANTGSSAVKGEVSLDVDCDIEAKFKIDCQSDRVNLETVYIDRQEMLPNGQVKVLTSEDEFIDASYLNVIATLEEWGFINIIEKPMYDIYFGWTDEGAVESVTINGTAGYKRGDVFSSDAEVVVTYHLDEDDDPSKIKPPYDSNTATGLDYNEVVQAFKNAGFTNVTTVPKTGDNLAQSLTVYSITIDGLSVDSVDEGYPPDDVVIIYYYIKNSYDTPSDSTEEDTSLTKYYAQKAFEEYGESIYPYGFKCHWYLNCINAEQYDDNTWYFKVGVTIENVYGNKYETIAEGTIIGTNSLAFVSDFYVS